MPFVSGVSSREPESSQTPMETDRRWGMRSVRTRRPFGRVVERMSREWGVVKADVSARTTDISLLFHERWAQFTYSRSRSRLGAVTGEDWVVEAKKARREGRPSEARKLYERAAEEYRAQGDLMLWAHSLRHAAELALEEGQSDSATVISGEVIEFYRRSTPQTAPETLEMANALRVGALASEASGDKGIACARWEEAKNLYRAGGIAEGVSEAERRLSDLRVGAEDGSVP